MLWRFLSHIFSIFVCGLKNFTSLRIFLFPFHCFFFDCCMKSKISSSWDNHGLVHLFLCVLQGCVTTSLLFCVSSKTASTTSVWVKVVFLSGLEISNQLGTLGRCMQLNSCNQLKLRYICCLDKTNESLKIKKLKLP